MGGPPPATPRAQLTRREVLVGGVGALALVSAAGCTPEGPQAQDYTLKRWLAERGDTYLIGHRGAGDVVPEHTLESYRAALDWGAKALEISVVRTSDDVLVCHHDLILDRTTTLAGTVSKHTWAEVAKGGVDVPRLGPRWQGKGMPHLPRLSAVLDAVGHRAVLCIEAKDDSAFEAMLEMVEEKGLHESTVVKLDYSSGRLSQAKAAGYPVFRYLGSVAVATTERIAAVGAELDPRHDYLVVPSNENGKVLPEEMVRAAVATKVPTWVFGVHRRSELAEQFRRGAVGAVTSSIGYVSESVPPRRATTWEAGALSPGEMTRRPESDDYGLTWKEKGVVALALQKRQSFLTLGNLAPLAQPTGPYQVDLEVRVDEMPALRTTNFTLAFAHADDRHYEHRQGLLDGYHALLRMDGSLELWQHRRGVQAGELLTPTVSSSPPEIGRWVPLRLEVTPSTLTWRRMDVQEAVVIANNGDFRGDYLHVGRSAEDGQLSVRDVRLS